MKILFLLPRLPWPLDRGDRVRSYNIGRIMARKHEVTLVSFYQEETERQNIPKLRQIFCDIHLVRQTMPMAYTRTAFGMFGQKPLQVYHYKSAQMRRLADEMIGSCKYDIVYLYHLRMAQYAIKNHCSYRIMDLVDSISLFMQRMFRKRNTVLKPLLWLEWKRVCAYEASIVPLFDECWIVSDVDRKEVQGYARGNIRVIPQAVDFTKFQPQPNPPHATPALLFVGYMASESVSAIHYFMREIWPSIRMEIPQVKTYLVGANPPSEIIKYTRDPQVIVTGFVKSLDEYYRKATVVIAPMRFVAGMQTKIIEAMAMKKAIVATSWSNEGIDAQDGRDLYIADTPEQFAERVIRLLRSSKERLEIGERAWAYVQRFSWDRAAERMAEIEAIIATRNYSSKHSD